MPAKSTISAEALDKNRILELMKEYPHEPQAKMLEAFYLLSQNVSKAEAARRVGVHRVTLNRWLSSYVCHGMVKLDRYSSHGRPPKITSAHLKVIRKIASTPPCQLGKLFHSWTHQRLARQFFLETGISITPHYLALLLKRMGLLLAKVNSPQFHFQKSAFASPERPVKNSNPLEQCIIWAIAGNIAKESVQSPSDPRAIYVGLELFTGRVINHFAQRIEIAETILFMEKVLVQVQPYHIILFYEDSEVFEAVKVQKFISKINNRIELRPLHPHMRSEEDVPRSWHQDQIVRCHFRVISDVEKFARNARSLVDHLRSIMPIP